MKKFIFMLIGAILCLCFGMTLTSCDKCKQALNTPADSVTIVSAVDKAINPQFTDVDEFVNYCKDESSYNKFINVVSRMHPNTIQLVATNAMKSTGFIDYLSFMFEYNANKQIYDNADVVNWRSAKYERADKEPSPNDTISVCNQ